MAALLASVSLRLPVFLGPLFLTLVCSEIDGAENYLLREILRFFFLDSGIFLD